jgi:PAS domain S-box-containing protein
VSLATASSDDFAVVHAHLASIVESSEDAIVSKDLRGVVRTWNRGAERIFGYSAQEMVGRSILTIIPDERRGEEDMILGRIHKGLKVDHFDTVRRRKDGSFVNVSVTVSAIRDSEGRIVGASKIARDISDRLAVGSAHARLAAIIESSDDAIVSKDLDGVVQSWNRGAERLFGYLAEEMIGQPIRILLPHDRQDEEIRILERIRRGEHVDHFETIRMRKDGKPIHVSVSISPIRDAAGTITGASKIARDISERKLLEATTAAFTFELENRVRERTAELELAHKEMEAFTYSMAHDLRTPLRSIIATSRMLLDDLGDTISPGAQQMLQEQAASAQQLSVLVNDLLAYARLSKSALEITEVDLARIARDIFRASDSHRFVAPKTLIVHGDASMLRILLQNLLDNARKFSPNGGTITLGQKGQVVFVQDEGIGFDMAYVEKIFVPFERLVHKHEIPGTGIGLANAKRIVEKHGGTIWASSIVGEGTTIYFRLPEAPLAARE